MEVGNERRIEAWRSMCESQHGRRGQSRRISALRDLILDDNDKVLGNYPFLVFKERLDRNRVLRCRSFYTQTDEWILAKVCFS